jgi:hypothetical protein
VCRARCLQPCRAYWSVSRRRAVARRAYIGTCCRRGPLCQNPFQADRRHRAGIYAEAAPGSGVGARPSALTGTERCSGGLDVEPIETHGPPPVSRPARAYSFPSEVAVASRPSPRAASPPVTRPSIGALQIRYRLLNQRSPSSVGSCPAAIARPLRGAWESGPAGDEARLRAPVLVQWIGADKPTPTR